MKQRWDSNGIPEGCQDFNSEQVAAECKLPDKKIWTKEERQAWMDEQARRYR